MIAKFRLSILTAAFLCCQGSLLAQDVPRLISSVPANGASGVDATTPVVFTFSEPMDTHFTSAYFVDLNDPFGFIDWTESWNSQMTTLTCTPDPSWPENKTIWWNVTGENLFGEPLEEVFGSFTTGTGSGGGGSNTNRFTTFDVGKWYSYVQSSPAIPEFEPEMSQWFMAGVTLASNRTATAVTLKLPTGATTNLSSWFEPEEFSFMELDTNQTQFEARFPQGDYQFTVESATSDQTVKVTLPANMQQPNAPHVSNFAATQSVDPAKPFTLSWAPFQGGTANDFIGVSVGEDFYTGEYGETNMLNGTATSVTIPAGVLTSNTTHLTTVTFYRWIITTNAAQAYDTVAYRASTTQLDLITTGGSVPGGQLTIESPVVNGTQFLFEATTTPGQLVTVESSSTLQPNSWQTVYTTNSPGTRVQFAVPLGFQPGASLYRLKTGP